MGQRPSMFPTCAAAPLLDATIWAALPQGASPIQALAIPA